MGNRKRQAKEDEPEHATVGVRGRGVTARSKTMDLITFIYVSVGFHDNFGGTNATE